MFNKLFHRGAKATPPEIEVTGYDHQTLSFRCARHLAMGSTEVVARLPDGSDPVHARLLVESHLEDQHLYWATLESPSELGPRLLELFPPAPEGEEHEEPAWVEKRQVERLERVLGIMSPVVSGFKALTHDLSPVGLRMVSDSELPVGKVIKLRLELDDARIPPMELTGQVVWCSPHPSPSDHDEHATKGFWSGILFTHLKEPHHDTLTRFIEATRSVERGVFSREYASD